MGDGGPSELFNFLSRGNRDVGPDFSIAEVRRRRRRIGNEGKKAEDVFFRKFNVEKPLGSLFEKPFVRKVIRKREERRIVEDDSGFGKQKAGECEK